MNQREMTAAMNTLRGAPGQIAALAREYQRTVREIHAERRYIQPAEFQRRLARAQEDYSHRSTALRVQCLDANSRLMQAAELARGESGRHDDPARAILEQRAWARILPILQRQQGVPEMIARAKEMIATAGRQGDLSTLRAIRSELPSYLEANEPADMRARRIAAGKSFAESDGSLMRLLDDVAAAGHPHLPPEERAAYEIEQALKPFDAAIMGNLAHLDEVLKDPNGTLSNVGFVGWTPNTYIRPGSTVEEPAQPFGQSSGATAPAPEPPVAGSMNAFRSPEMDD